MPTIVDYTTLAPSSSASVRQLLDAARVAAADGEPVDPMILREILWLTVAHPELLAFVTAANRLLDIIDRLPPDWQDTIADAEISAWRPSLEWIVGNQDVLTETIGSHFARQVNTAGNNPIRGSGSAQFPLYATLCEPLPPGRAGEPFVLLSAHLLLAHVIATRENSVIDDYETHGPALRWNLLPNEPDGACRAVRRMAEPAGTALLPDLPVEESPQDFAAILEEHPGFEDPDLERDRTSLWRFLQKAFDMLDWREGHGSGGGSGGGHLWVGGRLEGPRLAIEPYPLGTDSDPSGNWGGIDVVTFSTISSRKKRLRLESDLAPEEDEGDEEIILSDFECEVTKADAGANARAARAKARHVTRANQLLEWAYDKLTHEEVEHLIGLLKIHIAELLSITTWTEVHQKDGEAVLAIAAMLMTGSSVQRVTALCMLDPSRETDVELGLRVGSLRPAADLGWQIRALRPTYSTHAEGNPEQLRPQASSIVYPELFGLAPLVDRLIPRRVRTVHNRSLFSEKPDELAGRIRGWFKKRYPDDRVTPEKVANFLWSAVHQHAGDAAVASCVTGENRPLARVRLHYTSPKVEDLQRYYLAAVSPFCPADEDQQIATATSVFSRATAGARMCPTVPALRNMFERLREDIADSRRYVDRAGFAEHHNLLTLYTVQFFAYSTTCRAIVTPYLSLSEIDRTRCIASLSDKDDEFRHKTRLAWIPPNLLRHMEMYASHLETVKAELFDLPARFRNEPCLFLEGQDLRPLLVRPKNLEPLIHRYLEVRSNSHRRFLRTELLERGCSPEVIDAFMGHWNTGEEPFHRFSSFSFGEYVSELSRHLLSLLSEIGLDRPVSGTLAH